MAAYIIIAIIAYAIGSINFSVILSRKYAGFDIREKGSGNAGTTNMLRSVGKKAAILTLICDILKGVVAIVIAIIVGKILKDFNGQSHLVQIAAIFVVLGHTFPIFFEFRKRSCNIIRCFINDKLANWINMFNICTCFNGSYKNGIFRFNFCCSTFSYINIICKRTLYSCWKWILYL